MIDGAVALRPSVINLILDGFALVPRTDSVEVSEVPLNFLPTLPSSLAWTENNAKLGGDFFVSDGLVLRGDGRIAAGKY